MAAHHRLGRIDVTARAGAQYSDVLRLPRIRSSVNAFLTKLAYPTNMIIRWIVIIFASAVPFAVSAESLRPLLSELMKSHPRIQAEAEKLDAAKAIKDEAFAGYLPRLDASASKGVENTDRTALFPPAGEYNLNPTNANVTLTQNLFDGFRTTGGMEVAGASISEAQAGYEGASQQVLFEGISSYLNVLKQTKLLELAEGNMKNLQQQLNMEDERVVRGSGIAVDVLQAKSRLQISKERHTAFSGNLQDARSNFMQLFGKPAPLELKAPAVPETKIPESLEKALKIAAASSPALKVIEQSAEAAEHQKTVAGAGYYPSVDIVAASNYKDDASGIVGKEQSNSLVLRGTWQIFSGFADNARKAQAAHRYQAARSTAEDARRRLDEQVSVAWTNLETSKKRTELLENAVNIAGEVYDARKRLRDAGKETALNVLDAQNELFRAQIDATAARYDYYTALYRVLMTIGALKMNVV